LVCEYGKINDYRENATAGQEPPAGYPQEG
jgi:hypothetical protein